jgi:hypothetical protein
MQRLCYFVVLVILAPILIASVWASIRPLLKNHAVGYFETRQQQQQQRFDSSLVRFRFQNVATRLNLSVSRVGGELLVAGGDDTDAVWCATRLEYYDGHAVYRLWQQHQHTSALCLDTGYKPDTRFSQSPGIYTAYALACNDGSFQRWLLVRLDDGRVKLRNLATLNYLQASYGVAGAVYSIEAHNDTFAEWYLHEV